MCIRDRCGDCAVTGGSPIILGTKASGQIAAPVGDNQDAAEHFGKFHDIMANEVQVKKGSKYTVGPTLTFEPKSTQAILPKKPTCF